jgi:hypothetical protein
MKLNPYIYPLLMLLAAAMGCEIGYNNVAVDPPSNIDTTKSTITLTLNPAAAALKTGDTLQFSAFVVGTANTGVAWSVASGPGTIDSAGLYRTPATISADTVRAVITAISSANATATDSAVVTITKRPQGTDCDTVNVTYSGTVKPILQTNCYGCHSGATPPKGLNLTLFNAVKTVASNGKLAGVISHAPGFPQMPQGASKLPDCSIAKIKAWINKGALED